MAPETELTKWSSLAPHAPLTRPDTEDPPTQYRHDTDVMPMAVSP